jgi:hypothetical protein
MDDADSRTEATSAPAPRPPRSLQPKSDTTDKAQRLAAALRANLKRRKAFRPVKPSN